MKTQALLTEKAVIHVLVVADHVILRQGIRVMLDTEEDFEVVGETGD